MRKLIDRLLSLIWASGLERITRFKVADRLYTFISYWLDQGHFPNTKHPETYSDHLIRLKLSGDLHSALRQHVTDKEHLKDYVSQVLGNAYVVPTIGVIRSRGEIETFDFPSTCMIKPTHSCGRHMFRRDRSEAIDRNVLRRWFSHNYYANRREENYRNLKPKILVEELLLFGGEFPLDYKIHCVQGRPKLIHVISGGLTGSITSAVFSPKWELLPIEIIKPGGLEIARPENLEHIVDTAARLSAAFSFIRVDLYTDGKKIYVGELTNLPGAGNLSFRPPEADLLAGAFFREPDMDPASLFWTLQPACSKGEHAIAAQ